MKNIIRYLSVNIYSVTCLFWLLLLSPIFVRGQLNTGIGTGISQNSLNNNQHSNPLTAYDMVDGRIIEIVLQYSLQKHITLGLEPSVIGKHYKIVRSDYYQGVYQATYNTYIQLPILLTFHISNPRIMGGISAGGYTAYWANSRRKGIIPNLSNLSLQDSNYKNVFQNMEPFSYNETYNFNAKLDNRWEFGCVAGLDFQYTLFSQLAYFISARYYYALTNQNKKYSINQEHRYNETLAVSTGLLFKVNIHEKHR